MKNPITAFIDKKLQRFDPLWQAENGKGAYLKARSREIYDMLVKRFKLDAPKKKARVQKDDVEDEEE